MTIRGFDEATLQVQFSAVWHQESAKALARGDKRALRVCAAGISACTSRLVALGATTITVGGVTVLPHEGRDEA